MRIVGGVFGGRRFDPPAKKWPTRPTTDYAKEALYNILNNRLDFSEIKMLDLFGGTGSHCYEAISRGCSHVTYVDKFAPAIQFVKKTVQDLQVQDQIHIIRSDVFKFIKDHSDSYDYIFADPPYHLPNLKAIPVAIFEKGLLNQDGVLVIEHDQSNDFTHDERFIEVRKYGGCLFSFFS